MTAEPRRLSPEELAEIEADHAYIVTGRGERVCPGCRGGGRCARLALLAHIAALEAQVAAGEALYRAIGGLMRDLETEGVDPSVSVYEALAAWRTASGGRGAGS